MTVKVKGIKIKQIYRAERTIELLHRNKNQNRNPNHFFLENLNPRTEPFSKCLIAAQNLKGVARNQLLSVATESAAAQIQTIL